MTTVGLVLYSFDTRQQITRFARVAKCQRFMQRDNWLTHASICTMLLASRYIASCDWMDSSSRTLMCTKTTTWRTCRYGTQVRQVLQARQAHGGTQDYDWHKEVNAREHIAMVHLYVRVPGSMLAKAVQPTNSSTFALCSSFCMSYSHRTEQEEHERQSITQAG